MELFSSTTRFALACNVSNKIIEAIQSRCAILRFTRLAESQVLKRVKEVMDFENITAYDEKGLEAILFTAQGDMRHALNNLQSTYAGSGAITAENVLKVVDQPHPVSIQAIVKSSVEGDLDTSLREMKTLWNQGYSALDIIGTLFRVVKTAQMDDEIKLDFIKEIGKTHMRIADGLGTLVQLTGLVGRLNLLTMNKGLKGKDQVHVGPEGITV